MSSEKEAIEISQKFMEEIMSMTDKSISVLTGLAGVSHPGVYRAKKGEQSLSLKSMVRLARALDKKIIIRIE